MKEEKNDETTITVKQRPPSGPKNSDCYFQVVVVQKYLCYKRSNWDLIIVVVVDRWSLFRDGC